MLREVENRLLLSDEGGGHRWKVLDAGEPAPEVLGTGLPPLWSVGRGLKNISDPMTAKNVGDGPGGGTVKRAGGTPAVELIFMPWAGGGVQASF